MLHRTLTRLACFLALCLMVTATASAEGAAENAQESGLHREISGGQIAMDDLSIGYNGMITFTKVIPLTVTLENSGPDVTGTLAVNLYASRQEYDRYELPITLAQGARRQVTLSLRLSTLQDVFTVEFESGGQVLCAKNVSPVRTLDPDTLLLGALSDHPADLSYMNITSDNDDLHREEKWQTVPLTKDTFPSDDALLQTFGVIVIDDFDASGLSAAQLDALGAWLRKGGVLVLGGGAQGAAIYPVFSDYTGLTPGQPFSAPDITPALSAYVESAQKPAGGEMLLTAVSGGQALISQGDTGLLYRAQVGAGRVYTAAFAWGDKGLAAWPGMHTFLQRLLIYDCADVYAELFYTSHYLSTADDQWSLQDAASGVSVPNTLNAWPMLALAAAYLALGGVGGYFILKKLDKREWMWGLFPALTALCVAGIFLVSRAGGFDEPMAAAFTYYNLDSAQPPKTYAAVSVNDGDAHLISSPSGDVTPYGMDSFLSYSYYDQGDTLKRTTPTVQRYRFVLGEQKAVSLPFDAPWTVKSVIVSEESQEEIDVRASLWPEADGLHGLIENRSDHTLREGVALTGLGFVTVPDLAPGEQAKIALLRSDQPTSAAYRSGVLVQPQQDSGYYDVISDYLYPVDEKGDVLPMTAEERTRSAQKRSMLTTIFDTFSVYGDTNCYFYYAAFLDDLRPVLLSLDGQAISRSAHEGMVSLTMDYQPVGPNGDVYYMAGLLRPTLAALGAGEDAPVDTGEIASFSNPLDTAPVFCFTVPDADKIALSALRLTTRYYGSTPDGACYNFDTGEWDAIKDSVAFTPTEAASYFRDGRLFVRYWGVPATSSYSELLSPTLEIEGEAI